MANWLYVLELKHIFDQYNQDGDHKSFAKAAYVVMQEFADKATKRMQIPQETWEEVMDEFRDFTDRIKCLSEQTILDVDEVDDLLNEVYDWGDISLYRESPLGKMELIGKTCWINQFMTPKVDEIGVRNGYIPAHLEA